MDWVKCTFSGLLIGNCPRLSSSNHSIRLKESSTLQSQILMMIDPGVCLLSSDRHLSMYSRVVTSFSSFLLLLLPLPDCRHGRFFKKTSLESSSLRPSLRGRKLAKSTSKTSFVGSIGLSADSDSTGSDYIGILREEIAHE